MTRRRPGRPPSYDKPVSFFEKDVATHKAAAARAAIPALTMDLEEVRTRLQNAVRRRNSLIRDAEAARFARRKAAKLKHAPKREPVRSQQTGLNSLSTTASLDRWSGRKDAG